MAEKPTYGKLEERVKGLETAAHERRSSNKQLELLLLAVEQSSEGIAVVDLDGNLEYSNYAFGQMHGYLPEELVGKNLSIFHTPEQMPSVDAANIEIKQTGSFKGEIWHVKRNGIVFPTLMHNSLIRDDGKPIGIMGTLRDITDIKQTEEALRRKRDNVQKYLDIAGVIIVVINTDQTVALINKKGCQLLGFEQSEIIGKNWFNQFIPKKDRKKTVSVFIDLVSEKCEPVEYFENYVLTNGGEERLIAWQNSFLKNDEGKIIATLSSGEDITARMKAEVALKESEEKYRHLFKNAPAGIYEIDFESVRFVNVNDIMCKYTGYSEEEFLSMNPLDLLSKESKNLYIGRLEKLSIRRRTARQR